MWNYFQLCSVIVSLLGYTDAEIDLEFLKLNIIIATTRSASHCAASPMTVPHYLISTDLLPLITNTWNSWVEQSSRSHRLDPVVATCRQPCLHSFRNPPRGRHWLGMIVDLYVLSDIAVDVSVSRVGDPCGYPLALVWLVGLPCGSESCTFQFLMVYMQIDERPEIKGNACGVWRYVRRLIHAVTMMSVHWTSLHVVCSHDTGQEK